MKRPRRAPQRRSTAVFLVAVAALVFGACAAGASPGSSGLPGASGSPSPSSSPGPALTQGQLRLAVLDKLGPRWYCDPDEYPIAHGDPLSNAIERFPEMQAEGVVYAAVLERLGLTATTTLTNDQKLAIYQLWKVLVSIPLDDIGNDRYRFDYLAQPVAGAAQGTHTVGTIDVTGTIAIDAQEPAGEPMCPICLARGTLIDTPTGAVAVDQLALGDPVWTLDPAGRRIRGVVIALGSTEAPASHQVIRVELADGRTVTASPGHPLADGRRIGDLRVGDLLDGSRIVAAEQLPYGGGETFDIAVSGATGIYLAGGIPLGSTIEPNR
jgi:Hint domain